MNLLRTIIERLNQRIEVANIFDKQFGLCELNANGNDKAWVHYIGNGQAEVVTNFDAKNGTLFWAKRSKVTVSKTDSYKMSGCKQLYITTFPLTAYAIVRKSHLPCDSEDAQDWLASRIYKLSSGTDPLFKQSIGVINYEVVPSGYINEIKTLTANYEWACVSVDVDVQVITSSEDGCYDTCATGDIPLPDLQPCTPCLTEVAVDGVTIIGNGTAEDPLVAIGGGGGGGALIALQFTTDHLAANGNAYAVGNTVWYNGNVYRCIAANDSILPTNATYWVNLGVGLQTIQQPIDWNSTSGNNQILNKPTIPVLPATIVEDVTATAPIASSGGATPDISISQAGAASDGYLSSTDWNTFNGKFDVPTGTNADYLDGTGTPTLFPTLTNGTVTSVATAGLISGGPITASGTVTTSMATQNLVGRYSPSTGIMEEIAIGSGLTLTGAGVLNNTATPTPLGYYGAFSDVTDQFATVINTGYPMLLGVTDLSNQVTVVSGSRVTIANTGIYNIQWSAQFRNPTASEHDVTIWLRKNGVDVAGSSGIVLVPKKHGSFDGHILPSWNFLLDVVAGDYYEFVWSTQDLAVFISFEPAGNPPPSTASVVLTVTQQSGIMAGTGITAINSLTAAAQTLVVGTSGTDFAISSATDTHTFNLPTASAANRGALSSADWTTFNNKGNGTVTNVSGTSPIASSGGTTPAISIADAAADGTTKGAAAFTANDFEATAGVISIDYANGQAASASNKGFLTAANWTTFNNKTSSIYKDLNNQAAVTGTTANTKVVSQLVPANTFAVGDIIEIKCRFGKTTTTGLTTLRMYINTADSLTVPAATLIATSTTTNTTNNYLGTERQVLIKSATVTQTINAASSLFGDAGNFNGVQTNSNIDWTVNQYIIFAIQNAAIGDSTIISYFQIIKQ
jgi:hypothetical protein